MSAAEEAMIELAAKRLSAFETPENDGVRVLEHAGFARLILAMMLDCQGTEDCTTCTLGSTGACVFDRTIQLHHHTPDDDDEPPPMAACLV